MTEASIHQNSFAVNVEWLVSENFLWHMHFFVFSIQNLFYLFKTKFKKTIHLVSSDP